jgi:hypothetical protein
MSCRKLREAGGRGVTAAYRPFKPGGGGSNPSGPDGASGRTTNGGTKVLAAAHLALNQAGEGSSPSGPTSLTIRRLDCSRRARAGAFSIPSAKANWMDSAAVGHAIGAWESLGIRLTWDQESAGSNPAAPTTFNPRHRPSGRGAGLPNRTGEFDSRVTLSGMG